MNAKIAMDEQNKFSLITNQQVVLSTLQRLVSERAPITCAAAGTPDQESFHSRVVKVESNNDILIIQKPEQNGWEYKLHNNGNVNVISHLSTGTIKFTTAISGLDELDDPLFCELSLPQQLQRKQLRSYFRVPLMRYESGIILMLPDNNPVVGNCIDISMGGITGWFPGFKGSFDPGSCISHCHITIENMLDLCCQVTVSRIEKTRNGNPLLGLRFKELEPGQSRKLQQTISQLERRTLLR